VTIEAAMRQFKEDRRKLKELILYISQQCASDPNYGSTHLYKTLFFADFLAYAKFGNPITGDEYKRELHGPVGRTVRRVRREMVSAGDLDEKETVVPNVPKKMTRRTPVALRQPDLSMFSEREIELVNNVINTFRGWLGGTVSKYTHELPQWHSVPIDETIPYELVFVAQEQRFTEAETKHGVELARRHGWPLTNNGR
jgi:hypothetical protein